jgi:hypothetical protein
MSLARWKALGTPAALKSKLTQGIVIHPFLLGLFFILDKFVPLVGYAAWRELFVPISVTFAATLLLFLILRFFLKDGLKAGIATTAFLVPALFYRDIQLNLARLFSYQEFQRKLDENQINQIQYQPTQFRNELILLIVISLVLGLLGWLGMRAFLKPGRDFTRATQYLNALSALFVAMTIGQLLFYANTKSINWQDYVTQEPPVFNQSAPKSENRPSIYYILLDSYTSSASLKEFWHYDNSEFTNYLTEKGFYVPQESHSNYNYTPFSLASSLNMSHIGRLKNLEKRSQHFPLIAAVKNSSVVSALQAQNYDFVNLSPFDIHSSPGYFNLDFLHDLPPSIRMFFFQQTIFNVMGFMDQDSVDVFKNHQVNMDIMDQLKRLPGKIKSQPTFVYAHIMLPHNPYCVDRNGNLLSDASTVPVTNKDRYLEQVIFANKAIKAVVEEILAKSETKPIIIIQGDHGYRYIQGKDNSRESNTIFSAYYLPDGGNSVLYQSITPVNTFRLIFNYYFGANYKLLNDESFIVYTFS